MDKPLNTLNKVTCDSKYGDARGRGGSQPLAPRLVLGIAGVAMAVITLAVGVVLPARTGSREPEARVLATSKMATSASIGPEIVTTIDVVARREPVSSARIAAIGHAHHLELVEAALPAVIRLSSNVQ